mmetsp:Transcript_118046/g.220604  ORF Transcript_118046/g.220604 Transcript_118046/m.220604 type:complete len:618 (-) Transcript_118046:81-1934(-)
MSGGYPHSMEVKILKPGQIELHADEIEAMVNNGANGAKKAFNRKMEEAFESTRLENEVLQIVGQVDKNRYYLASSFKRDAANRVRDEMPKLKAEQLQEIVKASADQLSQLLQTIANASVRENMQAALSQFVEQEIAEYQKTFWSMIGEFFMGTLKAAGKFVTFGYYNEWTDVDKAIAQKMVTSLREHDTVHKSCTSFATILDEHKQKIIVYVRTKFYEEQKRQEDEVNLTYITITQQDEKAKEFAPWTGVLWCDPKIDNAENTRYCDTFRNTYGNRFHMCKEPEEAVQHIDENPLTLFTVITAGTNGETLALMVNGKINVERLLVFCLKKSYHETWAKNFLQTLHVSVHTNVETVVSKLAETPVHPLAGFVTEEEICNRLAESMRVSQHSQVQDLADKVDLLECVRQFLMARDSSASVTESEAQSIRSILENTDSTKCMELWTGNTFCFCLTTQLRKRTHDTRLLMICRLAEYVSAHITRLGKTTQHSFRGRAFRGLKINDEAVFEHYRDSLGKYIFFREFMATSEDEKVAQKFARGGAYEVILRIDASGFDQSVPCPLKIREWSQYKHEREVLFPLYSGFKVDNVTTSPDGKKATLDLTYSIAIPDPTAAFIYAFS